MAAGQGTGCAKTVYLTFDTGHMGIADLVAEVLKRHGVPVTFFAANERTQQRWNSNPFEVVGGGSAMSESDPGAWLLPYWVRCPTNPLTRARVRSHLTACFPPQMARYHGLIDASA